LLTTTTVSVSGTRRAITLILAAAGATTVST